MGAIAAIGVLLAIGLVSGETRAPARTLGAAAILVLTIALLLTERRGMWISLLCGLVLAFALHPQRRRVVSGRRLWAVVVVAGTAVLRVLLARPFSPALGDRPEYWRTSLDDAADILADVRRERRVGLARAVRLRIGGVPEPRHGRDAP